MNTIEASSPIQEIQQNIKRQFDTIGFAVVKGLFGPDEVEELREMSAALHAAGPVKGFFDPVSEAEAKGDPLRMYPRVMHPHRFNKRAMDFMIHPGVMDCLKTIYGEEAYAVQSMIYFKPPGSRGQALHQDNFYLQVQPQTCVAAWTAVDDADQENGGMYVVPNTNDMEIVCPAQADAKESFTTHYVAVPDGKKAVPTQLKAGDTLFFNGSLIHGSGPNRTKNRFRRSFICHYAPASLKSISAGYQPMYRRDGAPVRVENSKGGGICGEEWFGHKEGGGYYDNFH